MPDRPVSDDLDEVLARLPDGAWTQTADPDSGYRVVTITIDWRLVPGQDPLRLTSGGGGPDD